MSVDRAKFVTPDRSVVRDAGLRSNKFRVPGADYGPGTQPYIDAQICADVVAPIHAEAVACAKATDVADAVGQALDDWGARLKRARKGATKSQGFVTAQTATGGASIPAGTVGKYQPKGASYEVAVGGTYQNGQTIAVQSVDVGTSTILAAGSVINWISPPTGLKSSAIVFANTDGSGIKGGAPAEDDETYRAALLERMRNPPASGNCSHYATVIEDIPGLGVQKAFIYPAWNGPGTVCATFTMRPGSPGDSRLPNGAQLAQAEAALKDAFPADDGIALCAIVEDPIALSLQVTWRGAANGWVDLSPWPLFYADQVHVTGSPTNGSARVTSASTIADPVVGQTIGFLDRSTSPPTFKRKRILTVTIVTPATTYDLTFDTSLTSSDAYIPVANQLVSPWSPSLGSLVAPVLSYFDRQGPGEMFASFADPGLRQRRFPAPDQDTYPSRLENILISDLRPFVADAEIADPAVPLETVVGTPGTEVAIHVLSDLGVFPQ